MSDNSAKQLRAPLESYPWRIILIRWILLAAEFGLAIYFVMNFKQSLGIFYIAYSILCLFLLLPLIRCVRCYYYGKRCNFGWGVWAAKFFPRDTVNPQSAYHGYTLLFWPLRLIPIGLGILSIMGLVRIMLSGAPTDPGVPLEPFDLSRFLGQGLFLLYLMILFIHRKFYMARACSRCHQCVSCPVYNTQLMAARQDIVA